MKLINSLLVGVILCVSSAFAEEAEYYIGFQYSDTENPFSYVRISATTDNSYSPLSADGSWYNGFSDAPDVKTYELQGGPFNPKGDWFATTVVMDIANMGADSGAAYYFVCELLAGDQTTVLGYSSYADYDEMQHARKGISEGFKRWNAGGINSAPVPEPTSGLLLLLGGALLGLRRKRRVA